MSCAINLVAENSGAKDWMVHLGDCAVGISLFLVSAKVWGAALAEQQEHHVERALGAGESLLAGGTKHDEEDAA